MIAFREFLILLQSQIPDILALLIDIVESRKMLMVWFGLEIAIFVISYISLTPYMLIPFTNLNSFHGQDYCESNLNFCLDTSAYDVFVTSFGMNWLLFNFFIGSQCP